MTFDLEYLKACGFKVFNFVEDRETAGTRRAERAARRRARGAQGRRRTAGVAAEGAALPA